MLQKINRQHALGRTYNADLEARIQAFELAFRMQTEAPEVLSIDQESEATKKLYGMIVRRLAISVAVPLNPKIGRARGPFHSMYSQYRCFDVGPAH
jgi:hypothetical protein